MNQSPTTDTCLPSFPKVVCVLNLERAVPNAIKPDRADLAVVGLKVCISLALEVALRRPSRDEPA